MPAVSAAGLRAKAVTVGGASYLYVARQLIYRRVCLQFPQEERKKYVMPKKCGLRLVGVARTYTTAHANLWP